MKSWHGLIGILLLLGFIEALHVYKHSDYCKTESEWINNQKGK
jgi:hypothetical protein